MTPSLKVNSRIQAAHDIQTTKGIIKEGALGWIKHIDMHENREDWLFVKFDDWFIDSYSGQILLGIEDVVSADRPMLVVGRDYPDYSEATLPIAMPIPHKIRGRFTEKLPIEHHKIISWGIPGLKVSGSSLTTNRRHEQAGEIIEEPFQYRAILKITTFGIAWHIDIDRQIGDHFLFKLWHGGGG